MKKKNETKHEDFIRLMNQVEDLANDYTIKDVVRNGKVVGYMRKKKHYGDEVLS